MDERLNPGRIWRHKKTGGVYRIICEALIEATLAPVVVYCKAALYPPRYDHECWVRPRDEFLDGRFEFVKMVGVEAE